MKSHSNKIRRRSKLSKDELLRRLRLGDVRKLLRDRCGPVLPDDDAGREYLKELLLPISLGPNEAVKRQRVELEGPTDKMRRETERWTPWMSEDEARDIRIEINATPEWQRKPTAMTLGERLNVTYAERSRLQLRTIGPCDMTASTLALMRKLKKRQRDRQRRLSQGAETRAAYLAKHMTSKEKPWIALGISRRTYYYRIKQEQTHCTSPRQVKLIKTELAPVQTEELSSNANSSVRPSTATHAGQVQTCVTASSSQWRAA